MPSALSTRVERAISTLLDEEVSDNKNNIAIDVLRSLANQSALLLERQIIWDTIDSDPLEIFDSNNNADDDDNKADSQNDDPDDKQNEKCEEGNKMSRKEVERLKKMISVVSCERYANHDGYSTVDAVVQITKDAKMKQVDDCVRLTFCYERKPLITEKADVTKSIPATIDSALHSPENDRHDSMGNDIIVDYEDNDSKTGKKLNKLGESEESTNTLDRRRCNRQQNVAKSKRKYDTFSVDEKFEILTADPQNQTSPQRQHSVENHGRSHHTKGSHQSHPTQVTYSIDISRDYGKKERLLTIEIMACGDSPSILKAVPMGICHGDDSIMEEIDSDESRPIINRDSSKADNIDHNKNTIKGAEGINSMCCDDGSSWAEPLLSLNPTKKHKSDHSDDYTKNKTDISNNDDNAQPGRDRFMAYIDPDVLMDFVSWIELMGEGEVEGVKCYDANIALLLMTFPFYEHEWDLVAFLMDCIYEIDDCSEEENE